MLSVNTSSILVGAPSGQFPGGLEGIKPSGLACRERYPNSTTDELRQLPDEEVWPCYENRSFGLVYQCYITNDSCVALLGNGDPESIDGLLYDRVGKCHLNTIIIIIIID